MIQFYLLSILLNTIAGYSLVVSTESRPSVMDGLREYVLNETFRLVVGILSMAVGLFKLLSVVRGDVPVIGDLFPALTALAAGFSLIVDFYRLKSSIAQEEGSVLERLFVANRKWFGYLSLAAAAAHFLFPTVLFL